jgi:hypothetical protein
MPRLRPPRNHSAAPSRRTAPVEPSETGASPFRPADTRRVGYYWDGVPLSSAPNAVTATDVILGRIRVARENLIAESFLTQERRERVVRAAEKRAAKAEKAKERQRPQIAPISKPKRLIEP